MPADDSVSQPSDADHISIDDHLRIGTGITADERPIVVAALDPLASHLRSLDRESTVIEAWVKNRDERGQIAYVSINAKDTDIVASDESAEVASAFAQIRRDLKRQLTDLHDRRTKRRH